jgi:hypothetical protein
MPEPSDTYQQSGTPSAPGPELQRLDALVGRWRSHGHIIGDPAVPITGTAIYEWLPGGFFLVHHVDVLIGQQKVQALGGWCETGYGDHGCGAVEHAACCNGEEWAVSVARLGAGGTRVAVRHGRRWRARRSAHAAAQPSDPVQCRPSTPSRARLTAAASRLKSAATLTRPRTRTRRPPWRRRTRWASLRSTLGRVAR